MRSLVASTPVLTIRYDYAAGNILQGDWGVIMSATTQACCAIEIYDSSNCALSISIGNPGEEGYKVIPYTITPNGSSILLPISIHRGARISVKPLDAAADEGQLILNLFG